MSKNTEFWMTSLPQKLRNVPIIHLAIPGSHDSTTYAQEKHSNISPDARKPILFLRFLGPLLCPILYKWSKTQNVDITSQLISGIRYFDLRIALNGEFYFVHNLYSQKVGHVLSQIDDFLNTHPHEVVFLDCQHFYNLGGKDHKRLISVFIQTFGLKLLPYCDNMEEITLDFMTKETFHQVILLYRCEFSIVEEVLWPGVCLPTPWPDTVNANCLITFLEKGLKLRDDSVGFVSQFVLTPTVWFGLRHFCSSLMSKCFLPIDNVKYDWIRKQKPGPHHGVNIIISDFVEYQDFKFPKEVINLNKKLINEE